jgi:sporulation protein YlmC with PRC-barrel domain
MKIDAPLKLVSQLLDLPIIDKDERWCGIVDDVELSGRAGRELRLAALLVGPGAYEGRMPQWLFRLVRMIAGNRLVRVPAAEIVEVGAVVKLRSTYRELKLGKAEDRARRWIPRMGAM